MHYREVQIEDDLSVNDSGTLTVDLDLQDPLTALVVRFKATNDTTALLNQPPERQISKVEIVDGGQVYWSLNGQMAVAAAVNGLGRWPHQWYDERASVNQRINFPILFGRYLGDEQYAFNPRNLTNPQLKVTWTDQAGYLDDSLAIGVTARVMEGITPPAQCLMWKEVESWTTAGSGVHKVDLPIDYPVRAIMMRAWAAAALPSTIWSQFKLDCDLGKLIPFDLASHEFRDVLKQYFGPYLLRQFVYGTSITRRHTWMGEVLSAHGSADAAGYYVSSINMFYPWTQVDIMHNDGTSSTTNTAQLLIAGHFPHNSYIYPFGQPDNPVSWFNAPGYKSVALKITEGSADAAAAVAVQQPRRLS